MKIIIDRFEGAFAVVETEDKQMINLSQKLIPTDAKEGTVLSILIDQEETIARSKEVSKLLDQLFIQ